MEDFFEDMKNRPRPNIFKRIWLWWNYDGKYIHKEIKWGIQNILYWLPVIWKDRHWDSHYIFEVLKHKLKAQAKEIGTKDRHTRAQLDAKRMRLCVKLIQLVQDETYAMEYMNYHKDRVWFTPCKDRPGSSLYNSEIISENFDDYFKKYPNTYRRVMMGEGPFSWEGLSTKELKHRIAMNISHINQQRAHDLLFKIIQQNIQSWSD